MRPPVVPRNGGSAPGNRFGFGDLGDDPNVARLIINANPLPQFSCNAPINSGPQHWVLKAAIRALREWVLGGSPPPSSPLLELSGDPPDTIVRDDDGNALGGIRTPQVDVPIATLSGEGQQGSLICSLFGSTAPFDEAKLAELYTDHESYVSAFNAATDSAVEAGFILPPDAELMKAYAESSDIGGS